MQRRYESASSTNASSSFKRKPVATIAILALVVAGIGSFILLVLLGILLLYEGSRVNSILEQVGGGVICLFAVVIFIAYGYRLLSGPHQEPTEEKGDGDDNDRGNGGLPPTKPRPSGGGGCSRTHRSHSSSMNSTRRGSDSRIPSKALRR